MPTNAAPRVVVIGAGFAGLNAVRALKKAPVDILLIDRNNYHTFTPLLYQVATCGLDPSEIAYPIRSIFRKQDNVRILLGEVKGIDTGNKQIAVQADGTDRRENYDYLVLAAGSVTNFFGKPELERFAFGLKDLADSLMLRNHVLKLFERAAWADDPAEREALTTLVIVGGGPTGLETAGALYELYNFVLNQEYSKQAGLSARVVLVEALDTLLTPYPEKLQRAAKRQLESLGVEVILGQMVNEVAEDHVVLKDGSTIKTYTLVWAAGVTGVSLAETLQMELKRGRRIPVEPALQVIGQPDIYAAGDIAYLEDDNGEPYPQVIPVAQQHGKLAARNIIRRLNGEEQKPFSYSDRGIMATIGRRRAVAYPYYKVQLTGFFAWVTWLGLHLIWLMGFRNRLNVMVNWVWNYLTYDRSVRIIVERSLYGRNTPEVEPGVPDTEAAP
jgi:NADH dehydrogenase